MASKNALHALERFQGSRRMKCSHACTIGSQDATRATNRFFYCRNESNPTCCSIILREMLLYSKIWPPNKKKSCWIMDHDVTEPPLLSKEDLCSYKATSIRWELWLWLCLFLLAYPKNSEKEKKSNDLDVISVVKEKWTKMTSQCN